MKKVCSIGVLVWLGMLCLAGGTWADSSSAPDERQMGEALERARNALHDAMEALGDAGRLTLDRQLPKLQEQTDQALQSTQELLNQWEGQLLQELEKQKGKKETKPPPPEPDEEPDEGGAVVLRI